MRWREEFFRSIKSFDTEEKIDLYFYRPFGFLIAKAALPLGLSPTHLTLFGLAAGLASGYFFYHNETNTSLLIAAVLFVMAGVFDSSDGQLARMGGKSTPLGLVLDGICDNLVFAAAYIGSALTLHAIWGGWIWPVAVFAGVCHSFQSSMLDYYNREYLFFGAGKVNGAYWNPSVAEARNETESLRGLDGFLARSRLSWLWQQTQLSSRQDSQRQRWRSLATGSRAQEFQQIYRDHNRTPLRAWRLLGANIHTILLISAAFARRFDLYLIAGDILFLTIALFSLRIMQKKVDERFTASLRSAGLA